MSHIYPRTQPSFQSDNITLLDHGYIRLVETWGSDEGIVEAARMSTNKGFQGWGGPGLHGQECRNEDCPGCLVGDEKLLKHLYEHKHATPFEMAGMTIEVQAPIFVFREWHRHRTQSYNEMSARYTPLPNLNYIPTVERVMLNAALATGNKQAGTAIGAFPITGKAAERYRKALEVAYDAAETLYQEALMDGVPKELARVHLPVGRYSRMRASGNLRNMLAFLTLRMDKAAQWEIRQYANEVGSFIAEVWPRTWDLFMLGRA